MTQGTKSTRGSRNGMCLTCICICNNVDRAQVGHSHTLSETIR